MASQLSAQYYFDFEKDSVTNPEEQSLNHWEQLPPGRWECASEWPIAGNRSLHHAYDNPEAGTDLITFTHDPLAAEGSFLFSFRVRHGYPPSSANNWQVALLATLTGNFPGGGTSEDGGTGWILEGLVLGVNLTGPDDLLKLWQCKDGSLVELFTGRFNFQEEAGTESAPLLLLEVDSTAVASLYLVPDPNGPGTDTMDLGPETAETDPDLMGILSGAFRDPRYLMGKGPLLRWPQGRQLGVRFQYTSARDRTLWIDDLFLEGPFRKDTLPPVIMGAEVLDETQIRILFSEAPESAEPSSFLLTFAGEGAGHPLAVSMKGKEVLLQFSDAFPNRVVMELRVAGICDMDQNFLNDTLLQIRRNDAVWGDVVFNELMVDPDPQTGLPDREYIELFNRSGEEIELDGWTVGVNDRLYSLSSYPLEPTSHLSPGAFGVVTGISLPNEGALLSLFSSNGTLVHGAEYRIPWEAPAWKQEGGWALESPDPERVCGISELWGYSTDPEGGTPGRINSLDGDWPDDRPPVLLATGWEERGRVLSLHFSEPVRVPQWAPEFFTIFPGGGHPDSVAAVPPLFRRVDLWLPGALAELEDFTVGLPMVVDCSGNLCRSGEAVSGAPFPPEKGGVVINEIMYDPLDGAPEFIELLNTGNHFTDLRDLRMDVVRKGASPEHPVPLCESSRLLPPGAYGVLTPHVQHFMQAYHRELSGQWIGMENWKALGNTGGTLYLTDRAGGTVDKVNFGDTLHMEMLTDTRGISLERIDASMPGMDPGNWHSAASMAGYATPGAPNSQCVPQSESSGILQVGPKVFSPDNDGYEDLLGITLSPGGHGWTVRLVVTDLAGREVRILARNDLAAPVSLYWWDGEREDGRMVAEGFYVVHAWGYHAATGEQWRRKEAVGVIYR